jgi:hypothetical protein
MTKKSSVSHVLFQRLGAHLYVFMEKNGEVYWNRVTPETLLTANLIELDQEKQKQKRYPLHSKPKTQKKAA